jgi:hypothetical protein
VGSVKSAPSISAYALSDDGGLHEPLTRQPKLVVAMPSPSKVVSSEPLLELSRARAKSVAPVSPRRHCQPATTIFVSLTCSITSHASW